MSTNPRNVNKSKKCQQTKHILGVEVECYVMKFYNCSCYFTHNIYIKQYKFHFKFFNVETFYNDYGNILSSLGCDCKAKKEDLIKKILDEVNRRKEKEKNDFERIKFLKSFNKQADKTVYSLKLENFHPTFIKLVEAAKQSDYQQVLRFLDVISEEKEIYGFPIFKEDFCHRIIKELESYNMSDMPKERPNTMNNAGVLLDDIGFHDGFSFVLRNDYLDSIARILFPQWRGEGFDSHKIFSVHYEGGQDTELGYHYDNSEITLNVCLGKTFEGSEIYFGDMNSLPISESTCILVKPKVGYALLHRGRQFHGVLNITSGERQSLIMWLRSSSVRNNLCPMCNLKPTSLTPSFHYGDGFTLDKTKLNEICNLV